MILRAYCDPTAKRAGENISMGWDDVPAVASWASISPTTGANLNPWPEKPQAMLTDGNCEWSPMMKCSSGVTV